MYPFIAFITLYGMILSFEFNLANRANRANWANRANRANIVSQSKYVINNLTLSVS